MMQTENTFPKMKNWVRAVLYARVSSDDRGKEGRNLNGQLEMGREYAQENGYRIVAEFAEDDRGASGYEINLPKLNKIREMAHNGEIDVLIVREMDRLSRNLAKQLVVEEDLKRAGVRIEYVLTNYDDTPEGTLQKHIRATIAEYERQKINERMIRGKHRKIKSGHISSPHAPYGYRIVKVDDKNRFEIYEPEAAVVRDIFSWYIVGVGVNEIIIRLKEKHIPTPAEVRKLPAEKKAGRCDWSRSTIHKILSNKTYMGRWHWGKTKRGNGRRNPKENWLPVEVPPIISKETFEAAQERKEESRLTRRGYRKFDYLLSGRIICGRCEHPMVGLTNTLRGVQYSYYRCAAAKNKDTICQCDAPNFVANEIDHFVWTWLVDLLADEKRLTDAFNDMRTRQQEKRSPILSSIETTEQLIGNNKRKLAKLIDLFLNSDEITQELLTDRRQRFHDTIKSLERQKAELERQLDQIATDAQLDSVKQMAAKIAKGVEKANFASKRQIIELLDVRVTLDTPKDQQYKRKGRLQNVAASCVMRIEPEHLELMSKDTSGWG